MKLSFLVCTDGHLPTGIWALLLSMALTEPAAAQALTNGGGLTKALTEAQAVRDGLYAIAGVFAVIYLLYVGMLAFSERRPWSHFGWAVVYVAVVGGAVSIGHWAWSLFAS